MLAYFTILATSIAAFAGAPLSALVTGAFVLFIISVGEQRRLGSRFAAIGSSHILSWAACHSAVNAISAIAAAYTVGLLARVVSGL